MANEQRLCTTLTPVSLNTTDVPPATLKNLKKERSQPEVERFPTAAAKCFVDFRNEICLRPEIKKRIKDESDLLSGYMANYRASFPENQEWDNNQNTC